MKSANVRDRKAQGLRDILTPTGVWAGANARGCCMSVTFPPASIPSPAPRYYIIVCPPISHHVNRFPCPQTLSLEIRIALCILLSRFCISEPKLSKGQNYSKTTLYFVSPTRATTAQSTMYAATLLLAAASLASIVVSQSTNSTTQAISQVPTGPPGTVTLSSYSADSPTYIPPPADTSTFPAFSSALSPNSSSATSHINGTSPLATASSSPASNYTRTHSKTLVPSQFTSVSSVGVTATGTGPTASPSSTNAAVGAFRRVAGTGLALVVSGSLLSILL